MSQSNPHNPTADTPSVVKQAVNKPRAKRMVLILAVVALSLYAGSIAWFYATRGAA